MIECVFTIDYEIYGDGQGSLRQLVSEPTEALMAVFQKWDARFVVFVEAGEFQRIEEQRTDDGIGEVRSQVRDLYRAGFEIGLHIHPQWYNARYDGGKWLLDFSEYNLCRLPRERINQVVDQAIEYLRGAVGDPYFTPLSFRAGNWLFQPSREAADILAEKGLRIDSSVAKGLHQHFIGLDYRQAPQDKYFWHFSDDVNTPDSRGILLEIPVYTKMVPVWEMFTAKRVGVKRKGYLPAKSSKALMCRILDFARFRHPLKFDFCRMTLDELTNMIDEMIREDQKTPHLFKPLVAIGHSKDLIDFETVDLFLAFLRKRKIPVSTFKELYHRFRPVDERKTSKHLNVRMTSAE